MSAVGLAVSEYRFLLTLSMIWAAALDGDAMGNARRVNAMAGRSVFGNFVIIDWTFFEFIERGTAGTLAVAKVTQMMMHEECSTTQNYLVADAGEVLISHPMKCAWAGRGSR